MRMVAARAGTTPAADHAAVVHQHVPGSRFVRVEAAGHSTYFERPDVFNREVGGFLKGHRP